MFEGFDHGQGRAGEDGFEEGGGGCAGGGGVEVPDVLVHVEDVLVGEAFDVFGDGDDLLQVLVLAGGEDWIVDYDAVGGGGGVGGEDGVFDVIVVRDGDEGVEEAAGGRRLVHLRWEERVPMGVGLGLGVLSLTGLASPVGVQLGGRVDICENSDQMRLATDFWQTLLDLFEETFGYGLGKDDFA